jgi:hypothetical protein
MQMLIGLQRAGRLSRVQMVRLQARYLRETNRDLRPRLASGKAEITWVTGAARIFAIGRSDLRLTPIERQSLLMGCKRLHRHSY